MLTANRDHCMATMYQSGHTLKQIGQTFGVTPERVRQIIRPLGVTKHDGGQAAVTRRKRERALAAREAACIAKKGCTLAQLAELRGIGREMMAAGENRDRTPTMAFAHTRQYAKQLGTSWELTLWQWWTIWQESGRWEQRGLSSSAYMMRRIDKSLGYRLSNVEIVPGSEIWRDLPCQGQAARRRKREQYERMRG